MCQYMNFPTDRTIYGTDRDRDRGGNSKETRLAQAKVELEYAESQGNHDKILESSTMMLTRRWRTANLPRWYGFGRCGTDCCLRAAITLITVLL